MIQQRLPSRVRVLLFCLGCVLLTTLRAQVVLAEHTADSRAALAAAATDDEVPPLLLEASQPKPRYAGWLLGAYLVPAATSFVGIAAESGATLIASGALIWLAPTAVHLIAGEYGLAGRASLVLAFAAGGMLVGGLVGLGIGALIPEDQGTREEDPGLHRFVGAMVGGLIGGILGSWTWAFLDVRDALERDAERRDLAPGHFPHVAFSVVPMPSGVAASLAATF